MKGGCEGWGGLCKLSCIQRKEGLNDFGGEESAILNGER